MWTGGLSAPWSMHSFRLFFFAKVIQLIGAHSIESLHSSRTFVVVNANPTT